MKEARLAQMRERNAEVNVEIKYVDDDDPISLSSILLQVRAAESDGVKEARLAQNREVGDNIKYDSAALVRRYTSS